MKYPFSAWIVLALLTASACGHGVRPEVYTTGVSSQQRHLLPTAESTDPALARSLRLLAVAPSAEAHRAVAAEYLRLGITDTAHNHLSAALALNSRDAAAHEACARLWRDWGFPNRALPYAQRAVFFGRGSPSPLNTLGTVLHRLGHLDAARAEYERALSLAPDAAYILNNLCALDLEDEAPGKAIVHCSRALDLDPSLRTVRDHLARAKALLSKEHGEPR